MPLSRTRLRLALWFAGTVFVALSIVDAAFFVFLVRDARAKLTQELVREATDLASALDNELADERDEANEHEEHTPVVATAEVLDEWPHGQTRLVVYGPDAGLLGTRGPAGEIADLRRFVDARPVDGAPVVATLGDVAFLVTVSAPSARGWRVAAARSTAPLQAYRAAVTRWMVFSIPGVTLLAVFAGYVLARRSLRSVVQMGDTISGIAPDELDTRLPVHHPPDELDRLADRFNGLLGRLAEARTRNRRFVAQAAHQIRTPLTLVRGEAQLSLEGSRQPGEYVDALRRIGAAAEQMAHRVDELFLLAHAEAGEAPPLTDEVELDGLVFECTDLMRGRAHVAGRTLEIERAQSVTARGNQVLLREAVVELIENALRHGSDRGSIRVSAYVDGGRANLVVANYGERLTMPDRREPPADERNAKLGLSIVGWIAEVHGGELQYRGDNGENRVAVVWPVARPATHSST